MLAPITSFAATPALASMFAASRAGNSNTALSMSGGYAETGRFRDFQDYIQNRDQFMQYKMAQLQAKKQAVEDSLLQSHDDGAWAKASGAATGGNSNGPGYIAPAANPAAGGYIAPGAPTAPPASQPTAPAYQPPAPAYQPPAAPTYQPPAPAYQPPTGGVAGLY